MTTTMITLAIEAYHQGTNLGRLEGFRMIVEALGGKLESVTAKPAFDEHWLLDISVYVPPEAQSRCTALADKMFDGAVHVQVTGSRESEQE